MDVGSVLDIFTSGGLGAIVGAIGGIVTKGQEIKLHGLQSSERIAIAKISVEELSMEQGHELAMADKQVERAIVEGRQAVELKDSDAFVESIKGAFEPTGEGFIDKLKGSMRPVITIALLSMTAVLMHELWSEVGGLKALTEGQLIELFSYVVQQVVFLTVLSVSWWFASRPARVGNNNTPLN